MALCSVSASALARMVAVRHSYARPRRFSRARHRITRDEYDDYAELYRRGLSKAMIARWRWVSPRRVERALAAYGVPLRPPRLNVSRAAALMGVSDYTVEQWIAAGHLAVVEPKRRKRRGAMILIAPRALVAFLRVREAWPTYAPTAITDPTYRAYAKRLRAEAHGRWVSTSEIATALGVAPPTVRGWRAAGWPDGGRWLSLSVGTFLWLPDGHSLPPPPSGYSLPRPHEATTRARAAWLRELGEAYDEVATILRDDGFELDRIADVLGISTRQQVQKMIARQRKRTQQAPPPQLAVVERQAGPFSPAPGPKLLSAPPPEPAPTRAVTACVILEFPAPALPAGRMGSLGAVYSYLEVAPPLTLPDLPLTGLPLTDGSGVALWLGADEHYQLSRSGVLIEIRAGGQARHIRLDDCPDDFRDLVLCLREDHRERLLVESARGGPGSTHDVDSTIRIARGTRASQPRRAWRERELQR